jgi:hypothetical protein
MVAETRSLARLARHDEERFTVEVLIGSFESFCYTAHFLSGRFGCTLAEHIEDHDVADAAASVPSANDL